MLALGPVMRSLFNPPRSLLMISSCCHWLTQIWQPELHSTHQVCKLQPQVAMHCQICRPLHNIMIEINFLIESTESWVSWIRILGDGPNSGCHACYLLQCSLHSFTSSTCILDKGSFSYPNWSARLAYCWALFWSLLLLVSTSSHPPMYWKLWASLMPLKSGRKEDYRMFTKPLMWVCLKCTLSRLVI